MAEVESGGQAIHCRHMPAALSNEDYDAMPPFQWGGTRIPMIDTKRAWSARPMNDAASATVSCTKAQLIAIVPAADASVPNRHRQKQRNKRQDRDTSFRQSAPSLDLRLITGRLRDQWHTMTRTGLASQLNQHQSVPMLTIHPDDASQLGLMSDDFVQLQRQDEAGMSADEGASPVLVQVAISDAIRVGDAFMPMHWSNAFATFARVGVLIPTVVDPHSGQPELKNSAVSMTAVPMHTFGKILVHPDWQDAVIGQLRKILDDFQAKTLQKTGLKKNQDMVNKSDSESRCTAITWNLSRQANSVLINFACPSIDVSQILSAPNFWHQMAESLQSSKPLLSQPHTINTAHIINKKQDQLRLIMTQSLHDLTAVDQIETSHQESHELLIMAVYLAPMLKDLPSIHWLDRCFADASQIPVNQRYKWLLAGRPASGYVDPGTLVCSCMSVGKNTIIETITQQGCISAAAVGKQCRAGTNCGSCVGQINELIAEYAQLAQA